MSGHPAHSVPSRAPGGWTPDRPITASKRSLIAVSHAIEQALLDGPLTEPTVVVALFQRMAYLERARDVYARLAEAGAVVVLGFADGEAHQVPRGCRGIVLDPDEPLADEWTVLAVGPSAGAFLVATDAHRFDPTEQTLEAGREFEGRWGYSHVQAANELARMRAALGGRLDTTVGTTIDHLLARVMPTGRSIAGSRGADGEVWATISLHRMVERMQDATAGSRILRAQLADAQAAAAARSRAAVDPQSGLTDPEFLARWTNTGGSTALPVGVAVFDVPALDDAGRRYDARAAWHAARRVAAALTEPLGPVDAAVRISEREFAVVVPGASGRHLRRLVTAVGEQLELASDGYPGISLSATVASTVTLHRPLPLDDLHLALGSPDRSAQTLNGDPISLVGTVDASRRPSPGPVDTGPSTDAFPRIRVDSDPTTVPATEDVGPESRPDEPVASTAGSRHGAADEYGDNPRDGDGRHNGTGGHGLVRSIDGVDDRALDDRALDDRAVDDLDAGRDPAPDTPVDTPLDTPLDPNGDADDAPGDADGDDGGNDGSGGGVVGQNGPRPIDRDVARRADRALNMLSGLPRRNGRRDGHPSRSEPGADAARRGATNGSSLGHGTGGEPTPPSGPFGHRRHGEPPPGTGSTGIA